MRRKLSSGILGKKKVLFLIGSCSRNSTLGTLGGMFLLRPKPRWPVFIFVQREFALCSLKAEGLQFTARKSETEHGKHGPAESSSLSE